MGAGPGGGHRPPRRRPPPPGRQLLPVDQPGPGPAGRRRHLRGGPPLRRGAGPDGHLRLGGGDLHRGHHRRLHAGPRAVPAHRRAAGGRGRGQDRRRRGPGGAGLRCRRRHRRLRPGGGRGHRRRPVGHAPRPALGGRVAAQSAPVARHQRTHGHPGRHRGAGQPRRGAGQPADRQPLRGRDLPGRPDPGAHPRVRGDGPVHGGVPPSGGGAGATRAQHPPDPHAVHPGVRAHRHRDRHPARRHHPPHLPAGLRQHRRPAALGGRGRPGHGRGEPDHHVLPGRRHLRPGHGDPDGGLGGGRRARGGRAAPVGTAGTGPGRGRHRVPGVRGADPGRSAALARVREGAGSDRAVHRGRRPPAGRPAVPTRRVDRLGRARSPPCPRWWRCSSSAQAAPRAPDRDPACCTWASRTPAVPVPEADRCAPTR